MYNSYKYNDHSVYTYGYLLSITLPELAVVQIGMNTNRAIINILLPCA